MKRPLRILALLLALTLLLTAEACKKTPAAPDVTEGTTLPVPTEAPATVPAPTDAPVTEPLSTEVPTTEVPTTDVPTTAAPVTEATTAAPAPADDPASWTKDKAVAFVAEAVNKSKAFTGALTADHSQSFTFEIKSVSPAGAVIQPISQFIVNNLLKPTSETLSFSGGTATDSDGDTVQILLPKKQAFALSPAGVASFTAVKSGENVVVTLNLVPETGDLTTQPPHNAGAIGCLDVTKVTSISFFSVERFSVSYPGSTLKVTVNPAGYVTEADYSTPVALEGAGKVGLLPGSLSSAGESTEHWVLHW